MEEPSESDSRSDTHFAHSDSVPDETKLTVDISISYRIVQYTRGLIARL